MVLGQNKTILDVCCLILTFSVCAGRSSHDQDPAKFTFKSVRDSILPALQPLVTAGSNGCGYFKNFLGLSYDQMMAKNATRQENITIDLITKTGQIKNILMDTKKLKTLVHHNDEIVVLIHGFGESSEGEMVQALSSELLKNEGLKIFALDGRHTIRLEYLRSSTYSRFMGEMLGEALSHIIKEGHDTSKITLIGHSLGSHIAGAAGKLVFQRTGKLLGRIAALDPAGPCFHNVSSSERLDPSDAAFVDVIHTNIGILGLSAPVGHKDFYPNGGMSQPGCMFYICDHSRAWEFYAESINKPKSFPDRPNICSKVGIEPATTYIAGGPTPNVPHRSSMSAQKCSNWTTFSEGRCNKTEVAYMGAHSDEGSKGLYFLNTRSSAPFGLGTSETINAQATKL